MLSRHFKTFQVKCNFCLEWMSLSTQLKFNINVCDQCLQLDCQQKALKAVSPSGQVYQLSILKQDLTPIVNFCEIAVQTQQESINSDNLLNQLKKDQDSEFVSPFDREQITKSQEISAKWNIISSFINEKDFLSSQEIGYLKILISDKPQNLKKTNSQFTLKVTPPQSLQKFTSEFNNQQNWLRIPQLNQNKIGDSVSNFQHVQLNTQNSNYQKIQIPHKKNLKQKENLLKPKDRQSLKSPIKIALREKDLNRNYESHCKISELKENDYTSSKRVNTSFFDNCASPVSSRVSTSAYLAQSSSRSAFGSSVFRSITKRLNSEQVKKFQQVKNKILQYLEKNYDSQSLARLMLSIVFQAYENTSIINKSIELVSYDLSYTDFRCYLEALDWTGIEVLKLVNTKLCDQQLKILLDFITTNHLSIKVLVLTSNRLTQTSIQHLAEQDLAQVKEIYLGKNHINKTRTRAQTIALQNKYSLYL